MVNNEALMRCKALTVGDDAIDGDVVGDDDDDSG